MPLGSTGLLTESADLPTMLSTSAEHSNNVQEDTSLNPERYMLEPQTILTCTPKDTYLTTKRYVLETQKIYA